MSDRSKLNARIAARITDYLTGGGLFNPEMADHDAVRDLLMDCRAALAQPSPAPVEAAGRPVDADWGYKCPECGIDVCNHTVLAHQKLTARVEALTAPSVDRYAQGVKDAARVTEEVARDAHEDGCPAEEWRVRQALEHIRALTAPGSDRRERPASERSPEARQAYFDGYRAGIEAAARAITEECGNVIVGGGGRGEVTVADMVQDSIRALTPDAPDATGACPTCGTVTGITYTGQKGRLYETCPNHSAPDATECVPHLWTSDERRKP